MEKEKKLYVKLLPTFENPNSDKTPELMYVNDDKNPVLIHNQFFTGHVVFRVVNFNGLTPVKNGERLPVIPNTDYFENRGRKFSFQVEGRFRHSWTGDDILFGVFFKKPIILHKGFQVAVAMARYIDPALVGDLMSSAPYLCSPMACGMNGMGKRPAPMSLKDASASTSKFYSDDDDFIQEYAATKNFPDDLAPPCETASRKYSFTSSSSDGTSGSDIDSDQFQDAETSDIMDKMEKINLNECKNDIHTSRSRPLLLPKWEYGQDIYMNENLIDVPEKRSFDFNFLYPKKEIIATPAKCAITEPELKESKKRSKRRRHHFLKEESRNDFIFSPDNCYGFEFTSSYADLNVLELKLGVKIEVEKYINDQPVIYEARTRSGIVFWRIELGLTTDY